ncbi:unnamed protein product [Linum tenue]|uniref:Potassium transporter n=1 Tax=Linum tenue TaxID=586396 RepID=A0AAV0K0W7_9ROSI|nr:unnamed protein product [Linum tenue]
MLFKQDENKTRSKHFLLLVYQSFGIVFGDLATSPLYVYRSAFAGRLRHYQSEEAVFGAFSVIFWTLSFFSLFKYAVFMLSVNDNGEGGIFALYSLLCRHGKFSLLPNQQASDEELSTYQHAGYSNRSVPASSFRRLPDRDKKSKLALLILVLMAASMAMTLGVLTPAISVVSSIEGLKVQSNDLNHRIMVALAGVLLLSLFVLQYQGTHKVAFIFSPVVLLWLLSIAALGVYNIMHWNPRIYEALSPIYIYRFFRLTGIDGWISLGGALLCITGSKKEAPCKSIYLFLQVAFCFFVYPCLVLQYMGQAAFLSKNFSAISLSFYASVPDAVFWPVLVIAILATVVVSQAVLSATFSTVKQCHALGCFPRVKIVHKSKWIDRQIYVPEINWILMVLCSAVTLGSQDTTRIGNAYGIASMTLIFITTSLISLSIYFVWHKGLALALSFFILFGTIELTFLFSSYIRILQGGWVPLLLSSIFLFTMFVWHYGSRKKYLYDQNHKLPMKWILTLGSDLGIVRVPGIGLIYTHLANGVPATFSHFLTNLPAFYQIIVFVCDKTVPVPFVPQKERYLVGRIGPKSYRMYRCIVQNGYKDVNENENEYDFENALIMSIAEFIQLEAEGGGSGTPDGGSIGGRLAVVKSSENFGKRFGISKSNGFEGTSSSSLNITSSKSATLVKLKMMYDEQESPEVKFKTRVQLTLVDTRYKDSFVKEEVMRLMEAKKFGVAYVIGHSNSKAKWNSPFLKRFLINIVYSFLRKNCRAPSIALSIPQTSLIEVGMNYTL